MQQVRHQQFLMLHFVMAPQRHQVCDLGTVVAVGLDQRGHRVIDMGSVVRNRGTIRAADQAPPVAGMSRPGIDVVTVEQEPGA